MHPSQFPRAVRDDLFRSLARRAVHHKFHYASYKQAALWLALHEAFAPSRRDPRARSAYRRAFDAAAALAPGRVHVAGLGCGGGRKDAALLRRLRAAGAELFYTPVDASLPLVLAARRAPGAALPETNCLPLVCDLAAAKDLPEVLDASAPKAPRVYTFFGMLPNFAPEEILPLLARLVSSRDQLLLSANLAPGPDYAAGLRQILPQYDNAATRAWLFSFLSDLGVEPADGRMRFAISPAGSAGLQRVEAWFDFLRARSLRLEGRVFNFAAGERVRLFFSNRHTPQILRASLRQHGLEITNEWLPPSREEGVFLVRKLA